MCGTLAACSPYVKKPQLLHPGPAGFQRYNATQFDPYPQQDVGPEIVGGRPPDYAVPPNEVERAYQHDPSGVKRGVALPGPVFIPSVPPGPIYAPPAGTAPIYTAPAGPAPVYTPPPASTPLY